MNRSQLYALTVVSALLAAFLVTYSSPPFPETRLALPSAPVVESLRLPEPEPEEARHDPLRGQPLDLEEAWMEVSVPVAASTTTTTTTTTTPTTQAAAATTTTSPPATTTTAPAPTTQSRFSAAKEADFHARINSLRGSDGLPALSRDGALDARARDWARHLGETGSLQHSDIGSLIPPWSAVGENLGSGGSVAGVFDALAGSSGHRSNMMGEFTHVGIGVWVDGTGTLWAVHVFAGE